MTKLPCSNDRTGAPAPLKGTILLAHGVGNQRRSETVRTFAESLGKSLRTDGYDPYTSEEQSFYDVDGVACPASTIYVRDRKANRIDVKVIEFYWADLSSLGGTWTNRLFSIWRILVGLPKLGFLAVQHLIGESPVFRIFSLLLAACWCAVVLRFAIFSLMAIIPPLQSFAEQSGMFANLSAGMLLGQLSHLSEQSIRTTTLVIDFGMNSLLILLGLSILKLRFSGDAEHKIPLAIATTSLALTLAVTIHLPAAFNLVSDTFAANDTSSAVERLTSAASIETLHEAESDPIEENRLDTQTLERQETGSLWDKLYQNLYSVTRVTGISSYIIQFLFILVGLLAGLRYASHVWRERDKQAGASDMNLNSTLGAAAKNLHKLSILFLFLGSFLWITEFAYGAYLILADRKVAHLYGEPFQRWPNYVLLFCELQVAIVALPLVFSKVREVVRPVGELALDVMNYFPPVAWLTRSQLLPVALGARTPGSKPSLREPLKRRLKSLIGQVTHDDESTCILIAHSLGTVIAYDTLCTGCHMTNRSGELHLITLGSPLAKLNYLFPKLFVAKPLKLTSWSNVHRVDDYVGTQIPQNIKENNRVDEVPIGTGGHLKYFEERELAEQAIRHLTSKKVS